MKRLEITRRLFDAEITAQVLNLDEGLHVSVFGGTRSHIGAVSVVSPTGLVETTQFPGHKDGVVSVQWAETLSKNGYCPCVVEVGIHYDNLDRQKIDMVVSVSEEMLNTILTALSSTF